MIPTGTRVSFTGSVLTALGTRSALVVQSFLDKVAQALVPRAYTQIRTGGDWVGSNIVIEATLNHDKVSLEGVQGDFIAAIKEAGAWGVGNTQLNITAGRPLNVPSRIPDWQPNNPSNALNLFGSSSGLLLGGLLVLVFVSYMRR